MPPNPSPRNVMWGRSLPRPLILFFTARSHDNSCLYSILILYRCSSANLDAYLCRSRLRHGQALRRSAGHSGSLCSRYCVRCSVHSNSRRGAAPLHLAHSLLRPARVQLLRIRSSYRPSAKICERSPKLPFWL